MDKEKIIRYNNDELTVVWKPHLCIHSKHCWKELGSVFRPSERPWVNMKAATTQQIREQVDKCPSGALSYETKGETPVPDRLLSAPIIEVTPNGPLLVHGNIILKDVSGNQTEKSKVTAFCRCGHSANKPYCDGNHSKNGFTG